MDTSVLDFLKGSKIVPDLSLDFGPDDLMMPGWGSKGSEDENGRKVIYSPEPPFIIRGPYGDKETAGIRVRALVSTDGNVRNAEPLTTTGYPQLDIMATKFVRSWIFEPKKNIAAGDKWLEVDVILNIGN